MHRLAQSFGSFCILALNNVSDTKTTLARMCWMNDSYGSVTFETTTR